jgi:DNA-binding HxlR family transcriptional regulator
MLGRTYGAENCSAARTLEIVGERWSLLIIRDALYRGTSRYSAFERSLGIAPNILASRLAWFVEAGLMRMSPVSEGSEVSEYLLTEMGKDLGAVVVALTAWGDRWAAPDGPPVIFEHHPCGGTVSQVITCERCGGEVRPDDLVVRPGPATGPPNERRTGSNGRGPGA